MADNEVERWKAAGALLKEARESHVPRFSIRAAAKVIRRSEAWLRQLEAGGVTTRGVWNPSNPDDFHLAVAAGVVGADVREVLRVAGRDPGFYDQHREAILRRIREAVRERDEEIAREAREDEEWSALKAALTPEERARVLEFGRRLRNESERPE